MTSRIPVLAKSLGAAVLLLASASAASATDFSYAWTQGTLSARIDATVSGSNLVITLTNTSTGDPSAPIDILTGVFFDIAGDPTLTAQSALICATCSIKGGSAGSGGSVGPEWAYKSTADLAYGADYGISSTGLGLFGPPDLFPGSAPSPASVQAPDGVGFGITTTHDSTGNDNGGISGRPLIDNQVIFTLSGLSSGFNASTAISNVTFQYGTALNEVSVPEPATLALFGIGMAACGAGRFRLRRKRSAVAVA